MGKRAWMVIMAILMITALTGLGILYYYDTKVMKKENTVAAAMMTTTTPAPSATPEPEAEVELPDVDKATEDDEQLLKFVAVGDINLGRTVKLRVETKPERYLYPFLQVADMTRKGDVVFGNLEESITASTKCLAGIHEAGGKYVLKNEVEAINGIKYAGFNLLSIANNHILDYYDTGLFDTMKILSENNIAFAGAGKNLDEARKLTIIDKKGMKIGLLAYTDMSEVVYKGNPPLRFLAEKDKAGVAPTYPEYIKEDVAKARSQVDFLIVSFHWGVENSFTTTQKQIDFAHELMDSGVDMILGHHPHYYQGVEIYKGKPIFYSLGNFMFDQNPAENQQGFIMSLEFKTGKLSSIRGVPYKILDKAQIVPQTGSSAQEMLNRESGLCKNLNTDTRIEGDELVFQIK